MIVAFASSYGICSKNVAAKAILQGMSMCIDNGFHKTIVESESTLMVDIINRKNNVPWQIHNIIQIWSLMHREFFLFFSHLQGRKWHYRSNGQFGCYRQHIVFTEDLSFPKQARSSLNQEQDGRPNIRFKVGKNVFTND